MKKVFFVGVDMAPTNCFKFVMNQLRGVPEISTSSLLCAGVPFVGSSDTIKCEVRQADLVVLGLSSSPERANIEMLAAQHARETGVPYGFYSDMALCPFRPWLYDLAENASFLVGKVHNTSKLTRMYPNARVYDTGNPLHGLMAFPELSREEVRKRLGAKQCEKLILAPGGKFPAGNVVLWNLVIEAIELLEVKKDIVLLLCPHPGDYGARAVDTVSGSSLGLYEEMVHATSVRTMYNTMSAPVATAGADLVIEFTGDTSIRAAMLRIPLLNIENELLFRSFERETGSREIETVMNGSGMRLPGGIGTHCIGRTIYDLLFSDATKTTLQARQEIAYPQPKDPLASLDAVITALMEELYS